MHRQMDERTDMPSYWDARTHLKSLPVPEQEENATQGYANKLTCSWAGRECHTERCKPVQLRPRWQCQLPVHRLEAEAFLAWVLQSQLGLTLDQLWLALWKEKKRLISGNIGWAIRSSVYSFAAPLARLRAHSFACSLTPEHTEKMSMDCMRQFHEISTYWAVSPCKQCHFKAWNRLTYCCWSCAANAVCSNNIWIILGDSRAVVCLHHKYVVFIRL